MPRISLKNANVAYTPALAAAAFQATDNLIVALPEDLTPPKTPGRPGGPLDL